MTDNKKVYGHYFKELPAGTTHVDVYLLLDLYKVHNAAVAHAVKKLLCAGSRGAKDIRQDLVEARDSIQRAIDIIDGQKDFFAGAVLRTPVNALVDMTERQYGQSSQEVQDNGTTERMVPRFTEEHPNLTTAASAIHALKQHTGHLFMTMAQYESLSKLYAFRSDDARVDSGVSLFDKAVVFTENVLDSSAVVRAICNGL